MKLYKEINKNPSIAWITEKIIDRRINSEYYDVSNLSQSEKLSSMEYISKYFDLSKKRFDPNKYKKQTFKYIDISNVDINTGKYEISVIDKFEAPSRARKKVDKGDILISTVRPNRNAVAIISENDEGLVASTGFAVLLSKDNIDRYYSFAALKNQFTIKQLIRKASGGMYPAIAEEEVMSLKIPIPSPEIQKYIGDKVRRAEELREEAKAAKKDYEYIIQDIYYDSNIIKFPKGFYTVQSHDFDDKHLRIDSNFYNPLYKNGRLNSYKNVKLSKLVDLKKNCKIQAEEEYAYFEIGDLSTSNILDGKERVKGSELPGRAKLKLEKDDIIVSLVQESIEVTSYVDKELNNTLTTNGCAVLIPRDKSLSGYLYAIISSKYFIAQKCRYISGTNIRSMSKDDLLDMKIPIVEDEIITKVNGLVLKEFTCLRESKQLILEAIQDVEDLIEGNFEMSKLNNDSSTESRC